MAEGTISARLPGGEGNGLVSIFGELIDNPDSKHVVIAILDCKKVTIDTDTGDHVPTARIRRIEVVSGADAEPCRRLLERAFEQRTGKAVLPFELEQDVREAFGDALLPDDDTEHPRERDAKQRATGEREDPDDIGTGLGDAPDGDGDEPTPDA